MIDTVDSETKLLFLIIILQKNSQLVRDILWLAIHYNCAETPGYVLDSNKTQGC